MSLPSEELETTPLEVGEFLSNILLVGIDSLLSVPTIHNSTHTIHALELVRLMNFVIVTGGYGNLRKLFRSFPAPLSELRAVVSVVELVDQPVGGVAHLVD